MHPSNSASIIVKILYDSNPLIAWNERFELLRIKKQLSQHFKIKGFGAIETFLGIQATRNCSNRTLHISQETYVHTILQRFNMLKPKPMNTEMELPSFETDDTEVLLTIVL